MRSIGRKKTQKTSLGSRHFGSPSFLFRYTTTTYMESVEEPSEMGQEEAKDGLDAAHISRNGLFQVISQHFHFGDGHVALPRSGWLRSHSR